MWRCFPILSQDDRMCENQHQLSVAGKIKKHFNTGPKPNSTTAGVTVIAVRIRFILLLLWLNVYILHDSLYYPHELKPIFSNQSLVHR